MNAERGRILVVDDEPEIVEVLKRFLSNKGYETSGAFSGEEALSLLEKESTDLMLLDIRMPGLKGTEVARIVKQRYPAIKIIILTGYPDEMEDLSKDDLQGLFIKPVRLQELYNKLSAILSEETTPTLDTKTRQQIKARVLLIKARVLFIEPSKEVYSFLSARLRELSNRGENYELDVANDEEAIIAKLFLFNPDIMVVNASIFGKFNENILSKILEKKLNLREIITYHIEDTGNLPKTELERLIKAVEASCLKNGLIELKWIEI